MEIPPTHPNQQDYTTYSYVKKLQQGLTATGVKVSVILSGLHSVPCYLELTKIIAGSLKLKSQLSNNPSDLAYPITFFDALKTYYYATMIFESMHNIFFYDEKTKESCIRIPKKREHPDQIDLIKCFYCLGGICDVLEFVNKLTIPLAFYTTLSHNIAPITVFKYDNYAVQVQDVPILNFLPLSPKIFFFFIASCGEVGRWGFSVYQATNKEARQKQFEIVPLLKLAASIGRIIGFGFYPYFKNSKMLVVISLVGYVASLSARIIQTEQQRSQLGF